MTWIAPDVTRVREPVVADERATLDGLLEWHRATLLGKCAGLTGECELCRQAVRRLPLDHQFRHPAVPR